MDCILSSDSEEEKSDDFVTNGRKGFANRMLSDDNSNNLHTLPLQQNKKDYQKSNLSNSPMNYTATPKFDH